MKNLLLFNVFLICAFTCCHVSYAQALKDPSIKIVPRNGIYLYRIGETAVLNINVITSGNKKSISNISYKLSTDNGRALKEGTLELDEGKEIGRAHV